MNHLLRVVAPIRTLATGLIAAAVVLVFAAPAALAVPVTTGTFSGPGAGDGLLGAPGRAAVEASTGNLFVADGGNDRVQVFTPDGTYLTQFSAGLDGPWGVAVAVSGGQTTVYVSNAVSGSIAKFDSDEAATPSFAPAAGFTSPAAGSGAGELGALPVALAVDSATGDLLVADQGNARVSRYQPDGSFVSSFTGADSGTAFSHPLDVAVDSTGDVLVVDATGTVVDLENLAATSRVERFSSAGVYEAPAAAVNAPGLVAVDPDADQVVVVGNFDTTSTGAPLSVNVFAPDATPLDSGSLSGPAQGVATGFAAAGGGSDRNYAITDLDAAFQFYGAIGGQIVQDVDPPAVTVDPATDVTTGGATLHGTVDAQGFATTYRFEYTVDDGANWTAIPSPDADGGSGADPVDVQATLATIDPNTQVRYRLVATNFAGTVTSTDTDTDETFTTLQDVPGVVTGNASSLTTTAGTLSGTVNPYGLQTSYRFEYGTTTAYGSRIPVGHEAAAGNGRKALAVSQDLNGLQPNTTYHYRLVANSSEGDALGVDRTFSTDAAARPARGYEMVSPLDSDGVNVYDEPRGFIANDDGNAIVYTTARLAYPGSPFAGLHPRVRGLRTDGGWISQSIDVPTTNTYEVTLATVLGVSDDTRRAFVFSLRSLGGQGVEGNGNFYIHDNETDGYILVATSSDTALASFSNAGAPRLVLGGSSDLSTVAFMTSAVLTPDATGNVKTYVWTEADGLRFVSSGNQSGINAGLPRANQASEDGARMYVDDHDVVSLYEDGQLTPVSVNQRTGEPHTPAAGTFEGASSDGRYALFTSVELLTDDAVSITGSITELLLYRYDAVTGQLEFLASGLEFGFQRVLSGPPAKVDGDVYFTSSTAQAGASGGGYYLYHAGQGGVDLVAHNPGDSAMTSPSGRYLSFLGSSGQVELYDAQTDELECVSCRPDGGPSTGGAAIGHPPSGTGSILGRHFAQSVTDDGQVFFDTPNPLVAADVNGVRDVYAYHRGRIELISRGEVGRPATFMDATPSGSDVFFVTEDRLVGQDDNDTRDLYDARIGGGIAAQAAKGARAACSGLECAEPDVGASGSPPTASERVDGALAKPGARARARVSVLKSSFTSRALRLTVRVSGRGRVRVAGAGVVATGRSVGRAGRVTLKVPLTGKVRAARRAGRRVRVVVRVSLAPPFGAPGSLKLTRTLGR